MKRGKDELGPGPGLPLNGTKTGGKNVAKLKEELLNSKARTFELPKIFSYFDDESSKLSANPPPWSNKQADITDYFNYGFTEETWKIYCKKVKKMVFQNVIGEQKRLEMNEKNDKYLKILNDKIPLDFGGFGFPNDDTETKKLDLDFTDNKIFFENFWSYKSIQEFFDKSVYPDDPQKAKVIEKITKTMEEKNKDAVARRKSPIKETPNPQPPQPMFFPPNPMMPMYHHRNFGPPPMMLPLMPLNMNPNHHPLKIPPMMPNPMHQGLPISKEIKPPEIKKAPALIPEPKEKKNEEKEQPNNMSIEKYVENKEEKAKKEEKHKNKGEQKEKKSKEEANSKQEKQEKSKRDERRGSEREHKEREKAPERDKDKAKEKDAKSAKMAVKQPETVLEKKNSKPAGEEGSSRLWIKGLNGIKSSSSKKDDSREQDSRYPDKLDKSNSKVNDKRSRSRYDSKSKGETNGKVRSENEQPKSSQNGHSSSGPSRLPEVKSTGIINLSQRNNNIKEMKK